MSDDLTSGSAAAGASDDIATVTANAFTAAEADSSSAQPADTAQTPAPATEGLAVASSGDAPVGPIPLDRHQAILENTRKKVREEAEAEYRQRFGWAEQYQPDQVAQMKAVWDWAQNDPQRFIEAFQGMLPQQQRGAAQPAGPPGPDYQAEDGTRFYSAQGFETAIQYHLDQFRQKLEAEYGPIRQRVIERETQDRASQEAKQIVSQARQTWPMFTDLEADMKQLMAQNNALSLQDAYISAMRERGLKMQEERIRSEYGAQLQRKAEASTATPRSAPATPVSKSSLSVRDLVAMEFDKASKSR